MAHSLQNLPQISSRMAIQIPVKISYITMDSRYMSGLWQDYFRSWPSIMHYMDMNEAYRCLDGICGPASCLSGPISKLGLSEAGDATKSMVMWLILTGIWMTILELIWGRFCNEYDVWCCINLLRSLKDFSTVIEQKRINYGAIFPLESDRTA